MSKEVISTNLKRYVKLDDSTFKILVSYYFTGSNAQKEALGEADFAPAIEKMLSDEVSVIEGTLVDYNAIPGNYKSCLVQAKTKIIPVSTASLSSVIDQRGFKSVSTANSNNVFVDPATNNIWKKIISDSGVIQLVQTAVENLEDLMKHRLDVSEAVASARPLYALKSGKFDYAFFYNPEAKKVESGIIVKADSENVTVASRQQEKPIEVNSHFLITVAGVAEIIEQFEKDLKNSKDSLDVMQSYINFWYKNSGKDAANYIEKELRQNVMKSTASIEESAESTEVREFLSEVKAEIESAEKVATAPTKEEVEAILTTKFDKEKTSSFAYVEEAGKDVFVIKFTKPVSIDDISYILTTVKEIFNVSPLIATTAEFVNVTLDFSK